MLDKEEINKILQSNYKKYYEGSKRVIIFRAKQKTLRPILKGNDSYLISNEFNSLVAKLPKTYHNKWIAKIVISINLDKGLLLTIALFKYVDGISRTTISKKIKIEGKDFIKIGVLTYPKLMKICNHMISVGYKEFRTMGSMSYSKLMKIKKMKKMK